MEFFAGGVCSLTQTSQLLRLSFCGRSLSTLSCDAADPGDGRCFSFHCVVYRHCIVLLHDEFTDISDSDLTITRHRSGELQMCMILHMSIIIITRIRVAVVSLMWSVFEILSLDLTVGLVHSPFDVRRRRLSTLLTATCCASCHVRPDDLQIVTVEHVVEELTELSLL